MKLTFFQNTETYHLDSEAGDEGMGMAPSPVGGMDFVSEMYRQKFSCEICRKTFTRKYSLSRHYKEVHQGESRSNKFQSIGPTMVGNNGNIAGIGTTDARLLNDYGIPSMARLANVQHAASLGVNDPDVKIEEFEEDDAAPSMVMKRPSQMDYNKW